MKYGKTRCGDNVEFFHFKPILCGTIDKLRRLNDDKDI